MVVISVDALVRRAQLYQFLAAAFLYPDDNWTEDLPLLAKIARELRLPEPVRHDLTLEALQGEYYRVFGLSGPLCYETEYGLPHEFRHSQELADIAGFYNAFGFTLGGEVRERPDHVAVELEFMSALTLKEAYAIQQGAAEQLALCRDAQRKFLQDHLGRWFGLLAEYLTRAAAGSVYAALARFARVLIEADAERLDAQPEPLRLSAVRPTPLGPELSCADCTLMT